MDAEKRTQAAQDAVLKSTSIFPNQNTKSARIVPGRIICETTEKPQTGNDLPEAGPGSICQNPECGKILPPDKRKDATHCDRACWKRHDEIKKQQIRDQRIPLAVAFAERNPDIVYRISDWIKINMKRGRYASFRYYWERYRLYRQAINDPVYLNNNFEKTIKQLILNRFPELATVLKMKEK